MLRAGGFNAHANEKFDWIHDTFLILIRMFPNGCPPTVLISMNQSFDPHMHSLYSAHEAKGVGADTDCANSENGLNLASIEEGELFDSRQRWSGT